MLWVLAALAPLLGLAGAADLNQGTPTEKMGSMADGCPRPGAGASPQGWFVAPGRGRCWITFHVTCTEHPEHRTGAVRDDTEEAYLFMAVGDSETECLHRAQTYWEWCGNALSQQVSATFVSGRTTVFPPDDVANLARGGMEDGLAEAAEISASLTEWRRERNRGRPCGVSEHTDGRWLFTAAGASSSHPPCCHLHEAAKRDTNVCGQFDMPLAVYFPPTADVHPAYLHHWNHQFTAGRSDFLVHAGGNSCGCKDWVNPQP